MALVPVNVRIPEEDRDAMEALATREYGESGNLSDVMRDAIAFYLRSKQEPQETHVRSGVVEAIVKYRGNAEIVGIEIL